MNQYYHWSQIRALTIGQSLDGGHTPIFKVVLEHEAEPALSADYTGVNAGQYLYVFGEPGKQLYSYLQGDDKVDDKDAYREVMSDHLKFKQAKVMA